MVERGVIHRPLSSVSLRGLGQLFISAGRGVFPGLRVAVQCLCFPAVCACTCLVSTCPGSGVYPQLGTGACPYTRERCCVCGCVLGDLGRFMPAIEQLYPF